VIGCCGCGRSGVFVCLCLFGCAQVCLDECGRVETLIHCRVAVCFTTGSDFRMS